ncbi:hypothetical protein BJ508DRAFT_119856 [Ascobolus immersus RN42]|uniref:Argonaute complex, subunit Arb1 n=1 Tax=Ascobolus immersus RN42 TaxID=1160509 RepID=A0A3N4IKU9_ASCIM|nr:hypothetical protein BJ508DRAFT_119856 [Ascobolus immersus RN42]
MVTTLPNDPTIDAAPTKQQPTTQDNNNMRQASVSEKIGASKEATNDTNNANNANNTSQDVEGDGDDAPGEYQGVGIGQAPKKKKKRKSKKGKSKPSGFEEFFVEPPLTKEQYEEDLAIYSPEKPFTERIEQCIQRYRARRRFDHFRTQVFTNYLVLGGISSGQKMFSGGIDIKEGEDDAEAIAKQVATDFVIDKIKLSQGSSDRQDEDGEIWDVDFVTVVKAFLSNKVPFVLSIRRLDDLETCCKVVQNFLNYIIFHNVAPEYIDNVKEAIEVAKLAEKELPMCLDFGRKVPGDFNTACSAYFGGWYEGMLENRSEDWADLVLPKVGYTTNEAAGIVKTCLDAHGTTEEKAAGLNAKRISHEHCGFEIVGIDIPPIGTPGGLKALGKLRLKVWHDPEEPAWETLLDEVEIYLEKQILHYAFLGMKLECTIHTLDTGMHYWDELTFCGASFFTLMDDPDFKESDGFSDEEQFDPKDKSVKQTRTDKEAAST